MSYVFHRHCHATLPIIDKGEGVYLFDKHGKQYLDACGGAAVSNLGHSHQAVKKAMLEQLERVPFAHTGFFTSDRSERLAELICQHMPEQFNHVYLVSGGSEAVESALKMARQYFVESGKPEKKQFIARQQSYHGNTLGALAVGGNEWRREPFKPILHPSHHIAPCYAYRYQQSHESELGYSLRAANELEAKILELGADNVMAFVAEPIVGATAGAVPATQGYFKRIREICDQYDVLLILDEVMCGVGRSGSFFAFEQEEAEPDLVCMAKGLGAGYQPIGAVVANDRVYQAIADGSGFFQHGHTFMAHPVACAAAVATIQTIFQDDLLTAVNQQSVLLRNELTSALAHLPYIGDIRGKGLFVGIELVADKESKSPLSKATLADKRIKQRAMENGLMCYPMGGTIDGVNGHHILLAPPFIIQSHHIDELIGKLSLTLKEVAETWK
ncbi:TPA: aspartate aminotransferase family protein [Vibrio parahaemolyticus]|uniref:aspartate aminotransferase family protein n=1 Tax=Vibrio parahaemolyticus TaxID=670 RepID=UPI00111DABF3|nr:aspartate aminotransferase family protein [Vibrio parahaemolyticus]TOI36814.1 aspartate aminotransferase family protein [Vibrio parahaemolyticus]HCG8548259.1 aspartate aminotransferase family protein [Vibrio parahaemolyticus]HCH0771087.1 aspartate aminotransferase family protein [Vibrio parahaemolyticus]HCH1006240.1 aspartate aminotransferase family protein [Vibrio parahaemolyticus]